MSEKIDNTKPKTEQQVVDQIGRITSKLVNRVESLDPDSRTSGNHAVVRDGDTTIIASHNANSGIGAEARRSQVEIVKPEGSQGAAASYRRTLESGFDKQFTGAYVASPSDDKPKHLGDISTGIPEQFGTRLEVEKPGDVSEIAHSLSAIHEAVIQAERNRGK